MEEFQILYRFDRSADIGDWQPLDDVVMGGGSASGLVAAEGCAAFAGFVSLVNSGGFASVRSRPRHVDLSSCQGLELRVRGDRKRYRLRLRTDPNFDGIAHQATFDAEPDVWQTLRFPFSAFLATFRGWRVPNAPPLDPGQIYSFGLMIADGQAGPFRLEVEWLRAFRAVV